MTGIMLQDSKHAASTAAAQGVSPLENAKIAWKALASAIAGQPVCRLMTADGSYPRRREQPITFALPPRPAAVMIHGKDGSVQALCLDLDTSRALQGVVDADAARLRELLKDCAVVEDRSPSGGRHLYVLLAERMPAHEARELVEAMALLCPSLDKTPHTNVTDGCIRVPGSRHKLGGFQELLTPRSDVFRALAAPTTPKAVAALRAALAPELHRLAAPAHRKLTVDPRGAVCRPLGERNLHTVAQTGHFDHSQYESSSNARMAVLNSLAASGWSEAGVRSALNTPALQGLAALYGSPSRLERLLPFEWGKALDFTGKNKVDESGNISDTSTPTTHAGGRSKVSVEAELKDVERYMLHLMDARLARVGREGINLRMAMRALVGYCRAKGTLLIDVGCRSVAVALGVHHSTAAALMRRLDELTGGLVSRVESGRGRKADAYLLSLPQDADRTLRWKKGHTYAVRPVFRALGSVAALVYENVERRPEAPTTAQIIREVHMSRPTVAAALADMEALGMVRREAGVWVATSVSLSALAARLGVTEAVAEQIRLHRRERAAWHAWLDRFHSPLELAEHELYDPELGAYWLPPDASLEVLIA